MKHPHLSQALSNIYQTVWFRPPVNKIGVEQNFAQSVQKPICLIDPFSGSMSLAAFIKLSFPLVLTMSFPFGSGFCPFSDALSKSELRCFIKWNQKTFTCLGTWTSVPKYNFNASHIEVSSGIRPTALHCHCPHISWWQGRFLEPLALIALLCFELKQKSLHAGLGPYLVPPSNDRERVKALDTKWAQSHHKWEPLLAPLTVSVHCPMAIDKLSDSKSSYTCRVFFLTGTPPKNSKYKKVNLG